MQFIFTNDRPIYTQIVEQLELQIISGKLSPGAKVPTVRDLASSAKVNPNTMHRALLELENLGLIKNERTSGKSVTTSISQITKRRNLYIKNRTADFIKEMETLGFSRHDLIEILKNYSTPTKQLKPNHGETND